MAEQGTGRTGAPGGLPASVLALGEQLREADDIAPLPALFADAEVFAAERARIFARTAIIADHIHRLPADGRYFVVDTGARPLVLTRERADRLHALGNLCLHAGYPVCEDEDGAGERLHCPYHDWEYALDGRLLYPALSPERFDPARLRLRSYPLSVHRGLIFVDLSGSAPPEPDGAAALPEWLAEAAVVRRARLSVERNWKHLHQILSLGAAPILGFPPEAPVLPFGALGFVVTGADRAALLRLVPKAPDRTDLHMIRFGVEAGSADETSDGIAAAPAPRPDRRFFAWYWALMEAGAS
ncbi:MAG TPA: Rieske (2Fe-2S) protein [Stellaceae bacterium]|nr:Rieske (2Fe-2S) protein [Stellaceae bacterium]